MWASNAGLSDRPKLAWCCGYTPEEIIEAAGFWPCRLLEAPYPRLGAGAFLPPDFCSYVAALAEGVLAGAYAEMAGAVIAHSCHPMLHLFHLWQRHRPPSLLQLLEVPRQAGPAAVAFYAANLRRLWQELNARTGHAYSLDDLQEAIALYRETRHLLARLYALQRNDPPPLSGGQLAEVMALAARSSKELFNAWLKDRLPSWEEAGRLGRVVLGRPLPGTAAVTGNRTGPRILLSGSILPPGLVAMLEECGATVVADDLCCGARYLGACREEEVAAADADPFTYLAALYLSRVPCPRMREAEDRWEHLVRMVREYRTDGVVFYSLKFCDFHHYAFPRLRQRLQQSGIPVLRLETEYTPQMSGQWRTRVEAFLESLAGGSGCPAAGRGR